MKIKDNSFARASLFVCIDRFKSMVTTFTYIAGMQMSCSEFVSPDAFLDLGDVHRNWALPFAAWTLHGFFINSDLWPPANHPLNGVRTFANFFVKTSICP